MLPAQWTTPRLLIRDATLDDSPRLLAIFNANAHIGVWDPTFQPVEQPELDGLVCASIARRNARGHLFQLQAICTLAESKDLCGDEHAAGYIVGYYHITYGVPQPDLLVFTMFVLDPAVQNQRVGSETLSGVGHRLRMLSNYRAGLVEVWLKNWPALRMWVKAGFDRILEFEGDKVLTPTGNANVILELDLRRPVPSNAGG